MKLFKLYLIQRKKGITALFFFCFLFTISFWLYHLPLKAVLYPAFLCALLGMIFILADFRQARRKHLQLIELTRLTSDMISSFPSVNGIDDADYQNVIKSLQAELTQLQNITSSRYQDMIDYYTIWVHQIKTPIASMRLNLQTEDTLFPESFLPTYSELSNMWKLF